MYTVSPDMLKVLLPLYNSPQRHYHDLNHIHFCLSKLSEFVANDSISLEPGDIKVLTHTIWFHDAIYSPYPFANSSNEEESAKLFEACYIDKARSWSTEDAFKNQVMRGIRATAHHLVDLRNSEGFDFNTALMLDIDLSGFAKPFVLVYKDSELIFKEYACLAMTEPAMMANRVKFLRNLLNKEKIFYTDYFHDTYETIARNNIEGVIELTLAELDK